MCTTILPQVPLDPEVQYPELLEQLFRRGVALLLSRLPDVLAGRGPELATPQDPQQVTHAAKVTAGPCRRRRRLALFVLPWCPKTEECATRVRVRRAGDHDSGLRVVCGRS